MTQAPSPPVYRNVVSARSRRYRTIGWMLLVAIIGMAAYGNYRLMPPLRHAEQRAHSILYGSTSTSTTAAATPAARTAEQAADARFLKAFRVQLIFVYGYWTVVGLLVLAVLGVAWLDLREVLRNYTQQRRALWTEAVAAGRKASGRNGSED